MFLLLHCLNCVAERGKNCCAKTTIFNEITEQIPCFYNFKFVRPLGKIRYVTIRQQIGLEETIIKEIEQNHSHGTATFKEWQKEDCPK
jgi:hypothetical protein